MAPVSGLACVGLVRMRSAGGRRFGIGDGGGVTDGGGTVMVDGGAVIGGGGAALGDGDVIAIGMAVAMRGRGGSTVVKVGVGIGLSSPLFRRFGTAEMDILVSNSSRTLSFIMAPHVKQIDRVGARSRLQTGQIIGVSILGTGFGWLS